MSDRIDFERLASPSGMDDMAHLRVLVIDDDDEDAAITQRAMFEIPWFTCSIDCANDYASALQALRSSAYDVILLDHGLGAHSGLELLKEAFGTTLPVAVVLLTGMASHELDEAASRAGIAHLLEKSDVRAGPLERSVRYALERTRIESELRSTRALFRSAFDALSDHVAILDDTGRIVEVNRAWQTFASENGYDDMLAGRGTSYLEICDTAAAQGDEDALNVGAALRTLLLGMRDSFSLRYACDSPTEPRWFNVTATRIRVDGARRVMVAHQNVTERFHIEGELRDSAARHRLLFNSNTVPLWVADEETKRCISANDAALTQYGYTLEEFIALDVHDIGLPEDRKAAGMTAYSRDTPVTRLGYARHRTKTGAIIDVDVVLRSIVLDGRACQMVLATNITERRAEERERKRLVESLEFERNRLSAIFSQAPAFMAVMRGREHTFEMVNEEFVRLVGRNTLGQTTAAIPEAADQGLTGLVDKVLDSGQPYVATRVPVTFHGCSHYVNFVLQPLAEPDGTVTGVLLHGVNVTKEVASADALRQSEEQYRTLVELSPDGILIHVNGIIVFANGSAARILKAASPAALTGTPIIDLVHPDSAELGRRRLDQLWNEETLPTVEMQWIRTDGAVLHIDVSSLSFESGGKLAVHTVFRDTTQHRLLEEQLRQAQKMEAVGQLAGGVAHDFNNLLTVIKANVEFLLEDLTADNPHRADVLEVRDASDRAAVLTRQLLAFSRKQILQTQVIDINSVVVNVKPMLLRLIREDIILETRLAPQLGSVVADAGQIEQVILNLAVNARDAMPNGGRLVIETTEVALESHEAMEVRSEVVAGPYVRVAVKDTGTGITAEVRARILEPFFTTKPVGQGTGLGLATVYGIVKQSGGYLAVESELGHGTTFIVYLPIVEQPVTATHEIPAPLTSTGTETILLVEDMDAVREIAQRVLSRSGYTVLEARNGKEALEIARAFNAPIDLLLSDVVMPEMSGTQLKDALKRIRPDIVVLFMSGYAEDDATRRGMEQAQVGFVPKPFSPVQLLQHVRDALNG
ncbi:MAG: PAS domain S-box protein [bacterium]